MVTQCKVTMEMVAQSLSALEDVKTDEKKKEDSDEKKGNATKLMKS